MSLDPGSLLNNGRYRILRTVSVGVDEGGMGKVYQAEDTQLNNRAVAIKEMSQEGMNDEQRKIAVKLFDQEAELLSKLNHSNIPDIYAHFEDSNGWYLVMKFIEGESLEKHTQKALGNHLEVKEVIQIGIQLCDALHYLHTRQPQIIFRDLKPQNVMITSNGHVYLIDFGIARLLTPGKLRDTVVALTAGYAPPEQYGEIEGRTKPQSDIYSLGATLHRLLSGEDPRYWVRLGRSNPFKFPPLNLQRPAGLEALIMQMLEMDADRRPTSAAAVKQKLQGMAGELAGGGPGTGGSSGLIKTGPGGSTGRDIIDVFPPPPPRIPKQGPIKKKVIVSFFVPGILLVGPGLIMEIAASSNPQSSLTVVAFIFIFLGFLPLLVSWPLTLINAYNEGRMEIFYLTLFLSFFGVLIYCLTGNESLPSTPAQAKPATKKTRSRISRGLRLVGSIVVLASLIVWFTAASDFLFFQGDAANGKPAGGGFILLVFALICVPFPLFSAFRPFDGRATVSNGLALGSSLLGGLIFSAILILYLQPSAAAGAVGFGIDLSGVRTAGLIDVAGIALGILGALLP